MTIYLFLLNLFALLINVIHIKTNIVYWGNFQSHSVCCAKFHSKNITNTHWFLSHSSSNTKDDVEEVKVTTTEIWNCWLYTVHIIYKTHVGTNTKLKNKNIYWRVMLLQPTTTTNTVFSHRFTRISINSQRYENTKTQIFL